MNTQLQNLYGLAAKAILPLIPHVFVVSSERIAHTAWSRRPPLLFKLPCLAREGISDSGGSCQRGRVGAAHTNR